MNGDALGFVHRLAQNCARGTISHESTIQEIKFNVTTLECHLNEPELKLEVTFVLRMQYIDQDVLYMTRHL